MPSIGPISTSSPVKTATDSNLVARRVNRFVSQLYYMLEDSSNAHVLKWNIAGTSFCITNVQEFVSMLPKYFKGRTLGSFVRQLNMYNFHKVKGQKHKHVFRHPFFKRGDEDGLRNIRRKHVGKEIRKGSVESGDREMHPWNRLMADRLGKLREVLDVMSKQNQDLVGLNNRMVNELQHLKQNWQMRSRDLIGMTASLVADPDSALAREMTTLMMSCGLTDGLRPLRTSIDVLEFFNSRQGDQFKNEMNIFFVTEQLTSVYIQRARNLQSSEPQKPKRGQSTELCHQDSCTGGSTHNNTSGYLPDNSNIFPGDRHCNSVDDISRFDPTEDRFSPDRIADLCRFDSTGESEFESFMIDAFDSLSSDEDHLLMAED